MWTHTYTHSVAQIQVICLADTAKHDQHPHLQVYHWSQKHMPRPDSVRNAARDCVPDRGDCSTMVSRFRSQGVRVNTSTKGFIHQHKHTSTNSINEIILASKLIWCIERIRKGHICNLQTLPQLTKHVRCCEFSPFCICFDKTMKVGNTAGKLAQNWLLYIPSECGFGMKSEMDIICEGKTKATQLGLQSYYHVAVSRCYNLTHSSHSRQTQSIPSPSWKSSSWDKQISPLATDEWHSRCSGIAPNPTKDYLHKQAKSSRPPTQQDMCQPTHAKHQQQRPATFSKTQVAPGK